MKKLVYYLHFITFKMKKKNWAEENKMKIKEIETILVRTKILI